jgi:hypothetical protein
VLALRGAGLEQLVLFFDDQDADPARLVGLADQTLGAIVLEGGMDDPLFTFRVVEERAQALKHAVGGGDGEFSAIGALGLRLLFIDLLVLVVIEQSGFELLEVIGSDGFDRSMAEILDDLL